MEEISLFDTYDIIIGVDEAGRGCLAGPVYAGAVLCTRMQFDTLNSIDRLTDSKKLSPGRRDSILRTLEVLKIPHSFFAVDNKTIDTVNILQASLIAMKQAVLSFEEHLSNKSLIAVDGNQKIKTEFPQIAVVKGDMLFKTIGAASIVAKVTRDRYMETLHKEYPDYGFNKHKGYPSKHHRDMIRKHGITPFHRKTFKLL